MQNNHNDLKLHNGSRVAVIGGGPAGSFYTYFLLDLAKRADISLEVDIYDPKDFAKLGPKGCNHCGGIISETLVQHMASDGIIIADEALQRGIDSYTMHTDAGSVEIKTPLFEKRIAAVYRGGGPLNATDVSWIGFDGFLQNLCKEKGANLIFDMVRDMWYDDDGFVMVKSMKNGDKKYDLIVGAMGLHTILFENFEKMGFGYERPKFTKTSINEVYLGVDGVKKFFNNSMNVFLLDIPRLEFAAIIPKSSYVTVAMLGSQIDKNLLEGFFGSEQVKKCFPQDLNPLGDRSCKCLASMYTKSAKKPFGDRVILVGDCATSKLYKNGIGAAYVAAKAAASTSIFSGISANDFKKGYWPKCQKIEFDNYIGRVVYMVTSVIQKSDVLKRAILNQVIKERGKSGKNKRLSVVLWDMFTGSSSYRDVFLRTLHPLFLASLIKEIILALFGFGFFNKNSTIEEAPQTQRLGKLYKDGEIIIQEGSEGDSMYVIQSGSVRVFKENGGKITTLSELAKGEFFGEMAIFEKEKRSASVVAVGDTHILTIDKKTLMAQIQNDPAMAFRMLEKMSKRIRALNEKN